MTQRDYDVSMRLRSIVLPLLIAACSGSTGPGTTGRPPSSEEDAMARLPDALRATVVSDAAARAGLDPGAVRVVKAQHTTWRDGSLGCPRPGEVYTQALVDGWWIVLEAGGAEFDYRAADGGGLKLCEEPGPTPGGAGTY
jgi:hypothetical protein